MVIVAFFTLPLVVLVLHLVVVFDKLDYKAHAGEFGYIWGLLAEAAGLTPMQRRSSVSQRRAERAGPTQ
jgi:hypothetical protein